MNKNIEQKYSYYLKKISNTKIIENNKSFIGMAIKFKKNNLLKRTDAENRFRNYLFENKISFEEQKIYFFSSPSKRIERFYIADFFIRNTNTIIEIDGGYHKTKEQIVLDKIRDDFFKGKNIKTIRIPNGLVSNKDYLKAILSDLRHFNNKKI